MSLNTKDLTVTINGVVYSAPVISRVEKLLALMCSILGSGGGGGSSDPIDISYLTPEQMAELLAIINGQND